MKLSVKVKPNTKQQKIEESESGNLIVWLKSSPVEGKANRELIELLSQKFKVPKSQIFLKSGQTSRQKIVEIGATANKSTRY